MSVQESDPTRRFDGRAQVYARARPGYPDSAIAQLCREICLESGSVVVDLGCGTGLSSEPFLRAGHRVIGVEPNAAMRSQALTRLAQAPQFCAMDARAEQTALPAASADLVIAAQAFHWFDVAGARAEALRILRPPARAALLWNDRRAEGSDFSHGYEQLLRRFSKDYAEIRHRHERHDQVREFFGHARWRTITCAHGTPLDYRTLAERLNSASYVPAHNEPGYDAMMQALRELFDATAHEGAVRMEFETRILFASIAAEAYD